jgi:sugar phosphate isomerase/epimerase
LWHVHLGDNNRLPPGCGLIDFRAIVATLREVGYSGYLSAELLARPDPDTAARHTLTYMRSLLEV